MAAHAKLSPSGSSTWLACPGSIKMTEGLPLNPALTATPKKAAEGIYKAYKNKKDVAYVLPIWAIIMMII